MNSNASIIQNRYENNNHFYYPEMEKMLENVIEDPNAPINIPDDFISKSLEKSNFFLDIIQKVKILFQKVVTNIKYFFSSDYRNKYNLAIKKIKAAYVGKVDTIAKIAQTISCNREVIGSAKPQREELKNKIKFLENNIQLEKQSLEDKIDAKNLIVDNARALKAKREIAPTTMEKVGNEVGGFFRDLFKMEPKAAPIEAEAKEIADFDAAFPLNELTEDNILAYANDELNTPVIKDIKARKISLLDQEQLLAEAKDHLQKINEVLSKAVENITNATNEIATKSLENFFEDDDLLIPDISEEVVVEQPKELTPKEQQLQAISSDIENFANKDLATLVTVLLKRLPEDAITSWKCDTAGNFTLQLKQEYKVWMPGNDPVGGAVSIFGYEKNGEIKGKLEKDNLFFSSGVNSFVKVPILGYIAPSFDGIQFKSRTDMRIGGTYLGTTQWKQKNFSQTKKDWETKAILVSNDYPGGHKKFLEEKINNS